MAETERRELWRRPLDAVAGAVVPSVADAVDPDDLVERIDVNALLERVDVDALIDRIDVDALVDRVDLDKLLARVDLDRIIERVDVNTIAHRVDVDAIADRVDVDAIADRVDVMRVAGRVDVNVIADRVDVARVAARVDVDAIADRVDIDRILQRSTKGVSARAIDLVRRQIVGIDEIGMRTTSRVLRRDPNELPQGPPGLPEPGTMSGRYAGPLSRALALVADVFFISTSYTLLLAGISFLFRTLFSIESAGEAGPALAVGGLVVYGFVYFWLALSLTGRTIAMAIVGLKVVQADGAPLTPRRAAARTLALPFSFVLFGIGAILAVVDRHRRALHDMVARSSVVYDWADRPAALPAPLTNYLRRRAAAEGDDFMEPGPNRVD